ncbi:kinase suppressor of Ras 1-like isoform X2 [Synchiropus splendidus]|uniref:kinase suppressor of Ras 1-like isoform X2 n=1 Tax=Synchiropus splendidus TaxID=270530 RepID=UPI00237D89B3|nr:kinase suppressor of Ras 1-like isoform X2 [Synchiropus splendidus]
MLLPKLTLTRSKSQESQMVSRIEHQGSNCDGSPKSSTCMRKNRTEQSHNDGFGNSVEETTMHSHQQSTFNHGLPPTSAPYTSSTFPNFQDSTAVPQSSPQTMRRGIGLDVTHRFSTKSWFSQTCQVCQRSMMFGVKCKHCKLKCHNKCTKDAPSCRISFLTSPRMRRAESVPTDINNRINHTVEIPLQFRTLPKAVTKREHVASINPVDSSSNPSSATSSTPSSPAHLPQSNNFSDIPRQPPNRSPQACRDDCFDFQDVPSNSLNLASDSSATGPLQECSSRTAAPTAKECQDNSKEENVCTQSEDVDRKENNEEDDEDGLQDLPTSICHRGVARHLRGHVSRQASQTSVYLQEWDIPYGQLQLEELIGKGRWGKVHRGRWHGEVAIRLLEIDGNNQDHLKIFKQEVMNYRQTRHENVVLFMGACLAPPHLAIVTSFCTGVTLYSVVRERSHLLDINKTRQIAQEIVNGMSYLHAKGIIHKDLKSKNVFCDASKVVITDFGLFGMSGVVQEGRKKDALRIPRGWVDYLSPEIVRKMSSDITEQQLPFSKAADVYAFGTIWYELHMRDWPLINHHIETKIWMVGSSNGIKKVLSEINMGKEVTEILSVSWSFDPDHRPTFSLLADMLEKLPRLNRRLSHPGHFWKATEYVS